MNRTDPANATEPPARRINADLIAATGIGLIILVGAVIANRIANHPHPA